MVLLLKKLYLYFTKDPEVVHYFPGAGGVQLFPEGGGGGGGVQMKPIYILVIFQGECLGPVSPAGSAHGQCHPNGTIFITVRPLTIIVRHRFVRINDR